MSEAPKRLSKVVREFNVGISTIVDFLSDKGHEIDGKPNTKISADMYDAIVAEFGKDKAAKEKSQELKNTRVERKTITLDTIQSEDGATATEETEEEDTVFIKNVTSAPVVAQQEEKPVEPAPEKEEEPKVEKKEVVEEKPKELEPAPVVQEEKAEALEAKEAPKKEEPASEKIAFDKAEDVAEDGDGPKVLGKIDLNTINLKTRPDRKPKAEKKAAPKGEAKKPEPKPAPQKEKPQTKKKEEAPAAKESEALTKPVEPEMLRMQSKKLDGPTVVGKIELPVTQPKKKKPVASSSDNANTDKRKKRKRITTNKPDGQNRPNQGGQNRPGGPGGARGNQNQRGKNTRGRAQKKEEKPQLTEAEIQKEIKETLARLSGGGKSKSSKFRREKRQAVARDTEEKLQREEAEKKVLKVTEFVTATDLASMMDVSVNDIISACMSLGMMVSINQRLDAETLTVVAEEFGYEVEFTAAEIEDEVEEEEIDNPEDYTSRPPIITVMGHVDHGKTSLLDFIRRENVIAGEAGGITQHIGAYNVELEGGRAITFLDTPGHEAFTAMRARGAQVTDLAIIVIAADDSVMPQTREAINHAQAADVPMVFAFNKVDKPGANADKIREELASMNILVEDWGGKFQCQEISALKGEGIEELLEKVLLEADMLELKANPKRKANGTVIEASLDKGRGYVATMLVQGGTLRVGDVIVAGPFSGKVKALFNERGGKVEEAGPSHPVQMLGFNGAPNAGDTFKEYTDERDAKVVASKREQLQREQGIRTKKHITLDEIGRRLTLGDFQELNVIVKGDVDGSVEALSDSLIKLSTEQIQVNVIHKQVGQITESDVLLATASDAIIIGFQVRPSISARRLAEKEEIDIRLYSIIYKAIEELKDAMQGMLKPKEVEEIVCNIEVRETFKISKVGTIAGCYVLDGKVNRNTMIRLIRDGVVKYTGELGSLKRFKEDMKEVKAGYECGLNIHNFNDIKVGDIIEGYEIKEIAQTL